MDLQPPPDLTPSEDYWQALLDQGEVALESRSLRARPGDRVPAGGPQDGHGAWVGDPGTDEDQAFWDQLRCWLAGGVTFQSTAIGCNRGGLLVRVRDRIGFLPASQLSELPRALGSDDLRVELERRIGHEFLLRVIEVDPGRNRVICSERATQWCDDEVAARLDELESWVGRDVDGVVRSVCDFGAFVDLGNIDGLIHISEMSWQRIDHPSSVLEVGDAVRVRVLNVDRSERRVGLSLKQLRPDPWHAVAARYAVGDVIDAVITSVVDFGAFALVTEGVEGLVHISELSDEPFDSPWQVVREGQAVRARVLCVDAPAHRLGLSLRQV